MSRLRPPTLPAPLTAVLRAFGLPVSEVAGYWHQESRSIRNGSAALGVGLLATLVAGAVLMAGREQLEAHPGLIVLIPAAIGMRGSIFGALAARLGTGILTGEFEPELRRRNFLGRQIEAVAVLSLSTSAEAGVLAWAVAGLLGRETIPLLDLVAVSMVAGVASSLVLLGVTILIARTADRRGWNMDDVGAPLITATGDLITLPVLLSATLLLDLTVVPVALGAVGVVAGIAAAAHGLRHAHDETRRIVQESLVVLTMAVTLQVLAGIVLAAREQELVDELPALLGLVPPFAAASGSLGGMLASRLASKLHVGSIRPRLVPERLAALDISVVFLLALLAFAGTGAIGWVGALIVGSDPPSPLSLVAVSLLGGAFAWLALSLVAYAAATASFRFGFDPDNHGIPIVTAAMDFLAILCLVSAVALLQVG